MKKVLKSLALIAASAMTLASCQNELQPNQPEVTVTKGKVHVEFGATSDEPQTKVTLGTNDDIKFEADWITGTDKLWIDYAWETEEDLDGDAVLSETWNGNSFDADIVGPKDGEDHDLPADWVYTCYYPQPRVENNNLYFAFGANRDQDGATYAGQYDLMYGGAETTNSVAGKDGDEKVVFKMDRLTSIAYFHITTSDFDASEKLETAVLEITEADDNIIACDEVYYHSGTIYKNGANQSSSITLNTTQAMDDIKLWYNVIPLTFKKATLTLTTDKGKYIVLKMGDGSKEFRYKPGELQKAKIGIIPASEFTVPEPPAPEVPVYTLSFSKLGNSVENYNSYTGAHTYTHEEVSWSIYGNQSLDGNILRIGGKNTSATDRTITSTVAIPGEVSYIVIKHSGLGNGNNTKITVNSLTIESSTSSSFEASVTEEVTINNPSLSAADDLAINFETSHEDSYYRITMNYQVAKVDPNGNGPNNSYLTINSIDFCLGAVAPKYNVTISGDIANGTVTATPSKAKAGATVLLTATPDEGYDFTSYAVTCGGNSVAVANDGTFTMPEGDVTVNAVFTEKTKYNVNLSQTTGGTISADKAQAWAGQEVTLSATPEDNYGLAEWTVTYGSDNTPVAVTNNKFIMPAANVNVTAVFEEGSSKEEKTAEIKFGTNDVKINAASVTGDDDKSNTWTITTVGTSSFTPQPTYCQIGSSKSAATSITFTTTLPSDVEVTSISANFGGFSGTAGTVTLKVGDNSVGTGSLNAANDVTVTSTSTASGNKVTITVTGIAKGVKVYNITTKYKTAQK